MDEEAEGDEDDDGDEEDGDEDGEGGCTGADEWNTDDEGFITATQTQGEESGDGDERFLHQRALLADAETPTQDPYGGGGGIKRGGGSIEPKPHGGWGGGWRRGGGNAGAGELQDAPRGGNGAAEDHGGNENRGVRGNGGIMAAFGPRVRRHVADTPSPTQRPGHGPTPTSSHYDGSFIEDEDEDEDDDATGQTQGTQGTEVLMTQEEEGGIDDHDVVMGSDGHLDTCAVCSEGGDMLCCDGCPGAYHTGCVGLTTVPEGEWHCPSCTGKGSKGNSGHGNSGWGGGGEGEGGGAWGRGDRAWGGKGGGGWVGVAWDDNDNDIDAELERVAAEAEAGTKQTNRW
jgi:hypothetical protein